ncbi:NADH-ubiquinone oxidoreductase subunit GRIM-19 [Aspergillus heteromorphus CBS 117.55]|uniref:NADH dehydrogenase [ubiquinone] 1 alpha subcomplex subunit 13 n=1 Tax=Aspergillus heteromorphus CBS 117.55 TaxID=1448321 RepID=A0A317X721_9EURO|nr:NADH-ubiquinone oxidoreductase subunit GRIM-19 [Aspergillus heteromorphus CBS 117.55]PWY92678.1 NADH-ubiquinone oxidoreductase subunit GRIM-19 [Aspergillus heteromorphus CBS 117.55]
MPQDMPPVGGYSPVQYKRNIPARGFRPVHYLIGMHLVMAFGYYKLFYAVREQHELAREKLWGRLHILPLLQAEEDRDQARRYYADKAREKELFGTDNKVYHSDRFVRPTFMYTPSKVTQ